MLQSQLGQHNQQLNLKTGLSNTDLVVGVCCSETGRKLQGADLLLPPKGLLRANMSGSTSGA